MLASAAVTTGLFVLAGVVVGGLVTGGVNYAFEWRRERANARVAIRVLESELLIAGAAADWRLEKGRWSPWNFASPHRSWSEYRADIANELSSEEWHAVGVGFAAIDLVQRRFSKKPVAEGLDDNEKKSLETAAEGIYEAANTLRKHQGLDEMGRFDAQSGP